MSAPVYTPLQQSDRYAAVLRRMGRQVRVMHAPDGPPVIALTRRVGPVTLTYLPRADLSGPRSEVLCRLPRHTARLVVPEAELAQRCGWPILTAQHIAEINLPRSPVEDRLWANMHGKWRNRLRRALEGPLEVSRAPLTAAHLPLLAYEATQRRRRGYRSYPADFLLTWAQMHPHHATIFEARLQEQSLAFMLFFSHGRSATYVVGWTGAEGRRHHAHNLLMWSAMRHYFSRGVTRLDLGTIDTEGGAPLARFKLGCGARVRRLGPTLLVPPGFRVSP